MGFSESAKFMMSLSIDIRDGRNRIAAIKDQALSTCCDKRWAGLMEMMALSSLIGHVIYSVYPTCAPLFHGPIVPRMGTPPTSCYIMWTRDSALDNNGPFQPNHFVPLIASAEKKQPLTFAEIVKRESLKHPNKTEETKRQGCPPTSKCIPENNVHSTPFYGKKGKPNAINTAERTQSIAENPLKKRCVDEEEQNEGTSAVETPSVEEFGKEEEGEGTSALDTPSVEEFGKEEEGEGTSALDTPSVEEFVRAAHAEGVTAMENPSVEEFVNEKGKGEESTAVKTSSMEECVLEAKQVEVTSSVETPPVEDFGNEKEKEHGQEKLPERVNDDNIFVQEKKHEYTAFSTASRPSSASLSVSLRHIIEPSVRHARRKFSSTSYPVSTSASLCKHLTKTKQEDNVHSFKKGVQGKKKEGKRE